MHATELSVKDDEVVCMYFFYTNSISDICRFLCCSESQPIIMMYLVLMAVQLLYILCIIKLPSSPTHKALKKN